MDINIKNIINENENNKTTEERKDNIKQSMAYTSTSKEINNIKNIQATTNIESYVPKKYSYVPKITAVFSDGHVLDLIDYETIVQVEINLEDYIFPLISLRLDLPDSFIPKFQQDDDIEFKFELLVNSMFDVETSSMYDTLFNIKLKKLKQENSPIMVDELLYEENIQYIRKSPFELKLIPIECLDLNKNLFSGVYSDCNIAQMLVLLTEKINNKITIIQPDNVKKYKQIIFPPSNIFYGIEFLDQYYGIYDRGLKMFFGFDQNIIAPKNYFDATGTNKVKVTFSNNTSGGLDIFNILQGSMQKLNTDNLITITPQCVKILDRRHYIKETLGTIVSTYSRDDSNYFEQIREYDYSDNDEETVEKVKTYVNKYNNTNKEKEFLLQSAYTKQIELILRDAIIPPDSWFKSFVLDFESPNYKYMNGRYSMIGYYFRFYKFANTNGSAGFDTSSVIELIEV